MTIWSRLTCEGREATNPITSATSSASSGVMPAYTDSARWRVAVEAHQRELRLHGAGGDLGQPDRLAQQFTAQGAVQRCLGVSGRGVTGPAVVDLESRDRGHRDDQAVAGVDQRQQRPGDLQRITLVSTSSASSPGRPAPPVPGRGRRRRC